MIARIVLALVVAVVVWLVCLFVGGVLLPLFQLPAAVAIGAFIARWAFLIALLAGVWYFFAGGVPTWWPVSRRGPRV